MIDY